MKFDKDIIIGILVSILIVVLWNPAARMMGCENAPAAAPAPAAVSAPVVSNVAADGQGAVTASPVAESALVVPADIDMEPEIGNDYFTVAFSPVKGSVTSFAFTDIYKKKNGSEDGEPVVIKDADFNNSRLGSLGVSFPGFQFSAVKNSAVSEDRSCYVLEREIKNPLNGQSLVCRQEWKIAGNYLIDYNIVLCNNSGADVVCSGVFVDGGDLENWSRLAGEKIRNPKHSVDFLEVDGDMETVDCDDDEEDFRFASGAQVRWISVSNKYLAIVLKGGEAFRSAAYREIVGNPDDEEYIVMIGAVLDQVVVPAGGEKTLSFKYFSGPKISDELAAVDEAASDVMHLAWGPLNWLAKLLLHLLLLLHGWVGSYGWSIIILTILVRLVFWPITMKSNKSMSKMRDIKPKLDELKEKYKDNPQELNMKTMELYRAEGVNPLGGCLPILLQIPVFISLYQTLESAVQLRQQSFAWIADLSQPDTVAVIFGLPIHPLAITMTLLMVLQQLLTPMSVDNAQRKMMLLMPVVMLFVLYNLPAGLTLYWTVSSIFSIGQMLLQRKLDARRRNRPSVGKKEKA